MKHIVTFSGGKDSLATIIWAKNNLPDFDVVFCDTGWEHPATYDYLREVLAPKLGEITWIQGPYDMKSLVRKKGMFPPRRARFCSQELKVKPSMAYFSERLLHGVDCVNAIGVRGAESADRAAMTEWEWCEGFDVETWRPLLGWSQQDVIDTLKYHGVPPNPLYLKGFDRVGCWPCIYQRKNEINLLSKLDPARIDEIRDLETELNEAAMQRAEASDKPFSPRSFFQVREDAKPGQAWPIDRVVEWATQAGQLELFDDPNPGCARWGMCEANPEKGSQS